ncbi:MAG: lipopolysaccharide A protein, partial [Verrucomicrobia bacterium]|nr:lipopolysaccharide A protein [Verrucomicrobiota bacterium]
ETWQKPYLSIPEQLQHKFILSVEGNDVATNLKWIAQSNSLCFMTKPKYESWFMEGTLQAGKHYVQVRDDYADLPDKITYYMNHPDEAETIIRELNCYYKQFNDTRKEQLIGLLVAEKYLRLSGQLN